MRLVLSLLFAPALMMVIFFAGDAIAQEEGDESSQYEATKTTPAIREPIYRQLSDAQTAAEEERYGDALDILDELSADDLNSYERAQTHNIYAFIHVSRENYPGAVEAYENLLALDNLPGGLETNTRYSLAQLYLTTEQYAEAARTLERWFQTAENPSPEAYILLANAYYSMEAYERALEPVEQAITLARERGKPIKEQWLLLQRVLYYETGDYEAVAQVLRRLIRDFPKKEYWLQLSSVYGRLDEPEMQTIVLEMAYEQGLLTSEQQIMNLVQLLMQQEIPWRASKILAGALDAGNVERDVRTLRLLSQAYRAAKEEEKALEPLRAAARMSGEGDLFMQLAYAYSNLDRWGDAAGAVSQALDAGDLDRPDQAHMLRGTALYNNGDLGAAVDAFRAAARDDRSATRARQWIRYIEEESNRRQQLADVL